MTDPIWDEIAPYGHGRAMHCDRSGRPIEPER